MKSLLYEEYNKWKEETMFLSTGIFDNQHYKNIVNMGVEAVPFIKEILDKEDDWIVGALDEIYPNLITYEGYNSLSDVCQMWRVVLNLMENNFINEKENEIQSYMFIESP